MAISKPNNIIIPIKENILFSPIYDITINDIWNVGNDYISSLIVFKYSNNKWERTTYDNTSTSTSLNDKLYGNQSYIISLIKKDNVQEVRIKLPIQQSKLNLINSQDIILKKGYNMIGFYFNFNNSSVEMTILLTGGLGYIGSHIAKKLGSKAIILDNQSNSKLSFKKYLPQAKVYCSDIHPKILNLIFKKQVFSDFITCTIKK